MIKQLRSEFVKNVAKLMTGTAISQVILIVAVPILARTYSPADYAALALFVAISSFVGVAAGGRFEFSLMLPKDDIEALRLMSLAFMLTISIVLVMFVIILGLGNEWLDIFYNGTMSTDFIIFLPLGVLCYTLNNILDKWNTRHSRYTLIARAKVIHSIVRVGIQLSLVSLGGSGLIIGYICGFAISIIILYWRWLGATIASVRTTATICYLSLIKRYKNFPLFSAPSGLVSQLVDKLPSYALPFFGVDVLGNYSMTSKILSAPLGFLGISVSNVFFQRITTMRNDPKETKRLLIKAYGILFVIILLPMGLIFFYSEPVAILVLGPGWEKVGIYMKLLIPLQIMRFVVSPTSLSMQAFERQKEILLWMIVYLIVSTCIFVVGYRYGSDITTILAFSLVSALMYSIWIAMSLKYSSPNPIAEN